MTIRDLGVGKSGRVIAVGGEKTLRRRFLDMGITPRTTVTVKKVAPLGDPIEIEIRGFHLCLRRSEAATIAVEMFHS
jgi:Fe2+ transport system protein FeoA